MRFCVFCVLLRFFKLFSAYLSLRCVRDLFLQFLRLHEFLYVFLRLFYVLSVFSCVSHVFIVSMFFVALFDFLFRFRHEYPSEAGKVGEAPKEMLDTCSIQVSEAKISRVMGPKGANVKLIHDCLFFSGKDFALC